MQSAVLSWFCRFLHRLNLPTRSFIQYSHLIFFCHSPYWQSLPIRWCERYSESQPIRSWIWFCFIPCQLQVKLTSTLGWLSGAWWTLALGFQCIDFCVNKKLCESKEGHETTRALHHQIKMLRNLVQYLEKVVELDKRWMQQTLETFDFHLC